jgi:hypothetical protein
VTDDVSLELPPINDAQRCGMRALASLFQLHVAKRGMKQERLYTLRKTRAAPGALPEGAAEVSVVRLLAAKAECKRDVLAVCQALGLHFTPRKPADTVAAAPPLPPAPPAPLPPPAPPPPPRLTPAKWFIDRGQPRAASAAPS